MKCYKCHKELGMLSQFTCKHCGKTMCKDCAVNVHSNSKADDLLHKVDSYWKTPKFSLRKMSRYLCEDCAKVYQQKINIMASAIESHYDVVLVSQNYRGNKYSHLTSVCSLTTGYYRSRNEAEEELKTMAKGIGCHYVVDVYYESEEASEDTKGGGTHYFRVWRYNGVAAKT